MNWSDDFKFELNLYWGGKMKTAKISFFSCLIAITLSIATVVQAIPTDYSKASFENPDPFKFNKNKFSFSSAIKTDPQSSYLTDVWNIYVDLKALKKEDLSTSNVTGYYLETNVETGETEVVKFSETFRKFTVDEKPENHYAFEGEFALSDITGLKPDEAELWYIYGNFVSPGDNKYDVFNGWVSFRMPDTRPGPGAPVPEPATLLLVGSGMICITAVRRKRKE